MPSPKRSKSQPQTLKTGKLAGNRGYGRPTNAELRPREHLTAKEVQKLMQAAASTGRYGHRDSLLVFLIAYRHALRVSELVSLRWDQIDMADALLHVRRNKNGTQATHPKQGPVIRALRRESKLSPYVFVTKRAAALIDSGVRKIIRRAGEIAGFVRIRSTLTC
jgi:integrase